MKTVDAMMGIIESNIILRDKWEDEMEDLERKEDLGQLTKEDCINYSTLKALFLNTARQDRDYIDKIALAIK